eukprot:4896727-Pleurochrysis_carterae.AAC.1
MAWSDAAGRSRAEAAAAYPRQMNMAIAEALLAAVEGQHRDAGVATEAAALRTETVPEAEVDGGRVTDGPGLSAYVRARVEAA